MIRIWSKWVTTSTFWLFFFFFYSNMSADLVGGFSPFLFLNQTACLFSPFLLLFPFLFFFFLPYLYVSSLYDYFFSPDLSCSFLIICYLSVWKNPPLWSRFDQDACTHWVGIHWGTVSPAWRLHWDNYTELHTGCVIRKCHRVLCVHSYECVLLIWCLCMWQSRSLYRQFLC